MMPRLIHSSPIRLIDGPLVYTQRAETVAKMAKTLIEEDAFQNEQDAIRLLTFKGFGLVEVFHMIDDARQVATQHVVAREMAKS